MDWQAARFKYENSAHDDPVAAIYHQYKYVSGVSRQEIEAYAMEHGWQRLVVPPPPRSKRTEAAPEDAPPAEVGEMVRELQEKIAEARRVTPEMMHGIMAVAMIYALQRGNVKDIVTITDQVGKHKDVGAWKETSTQAPATTAQTASPEEIRKLTDKLTEVMKGASPAARDAIGSFQSLLDRRDQGDDGPAKPH